MAVYSYKAFTLDGKKREGVVDADSLTSAKEKLKKLEMIVTKIGVVKKSKETKLASDVVIGFTREVSQLLKAGLPLYESLLTLQEKYENHPCHFLFLDLCDKIKEGKRLSEALALHPKNFDAIYIAMVTAGENTGQLENTFHQLYKILSRGEKFRKQIRSAMVYPAFLLSFCILLLFGLFFFLVPSMGELLEGRELHPMTEMILRISKSLRSDWPWFLGGVFTAILALISLVKIFKDSLKALLIHLPFVKTLIQEATLMRFSKALSVLLSSGVPIIEALRLSRGVMYQKSFEAVIIGAEEGLVSGEKLSRMLAKSALIPPLMVRMLATAEETGKAPEMLANIGEIYEEMLEKSLSQFTNLIQPVMLLVLGLVVGAVLLSVLLPLTDVSSLL